MALPLTELLYCQTLLPIPAGQVTGCYDPSVGALQTLGKFRLRVGSKRMYSNCPPAATSIKVTRIVEFVVDSFKEFNIVRNQFPSQ